MADKPGWIDADELCRLLDAWPTKPRVVLAISGGGATGAYEGGVLEALLEKLGPRHRPIAVSGSSAGALNALIFLVDRLGGGIQLAGEDSLFIRVWRLVAAHNAGAKLVVGSLGNVAIQLLSRLPRLSRLWSLLALLPFAALTAGLFFVLDDCDGSAWWWTLAKAFGLAILLTLGAAAVGLAALVFRSSLFANGALEQTLASVIARGTTLGEVAGTVEEASRNWVRRWYQADDRPDFVVTSTDLETQGEALFALVRPAAFHKLVAEQWQVFQFAPEAPDAQAYLPAASLQDNCGLVDPEDFVRCVMASTSIPGVFAPQRIALQPFGTGKRVRHDFVDGGVLNNSPIHVAIDLGAPHVISLELDPIDEPTTFQLEAPRTSPAIATNLARTGATLLHQTTSEDIRRAVSWNRELKRLGPQTSAAKKRIVEIFRIAPRTRQLGTLEFDGHYPTFGGPPNPSLGAWLEQGSADLRGPEPRIWPATYQVAPETG